MKALLVILASITFLTLIALILLNSYTLTQDNYIGFTLSYLGGVLAAISLSLQLREN